jgi:ubiquinone/menaquinone biosynthesis C-methylase UbiE
LAFSPSKEIFDMDQNRSTKRAEQALGQLSAGHILDVATGNGSFITYLLDNIQDFHEITAIDLNERSLEAARKAHPQENIHFLCMDAAHCDFQDGHFDTVCIAYSLHHMDNLPAVLAEMLRVCRPGGHFIISEMYRDGQSETQQTHVRLHHWWAAIDRAEGITHHQTYTRQEIIEIIDQLHLSAIEYYDLLDLDADPLDPQLIRELDIIIDRYLQRTQGLPGGSTLLERGEQLRQRVHEVGFQGATTLLMIGKK